MLEPFRGGAEPFARAGVDDGDPAEDVRVDELGICDGEKALVEGEIAAHGGVDAGGNDDAAVGTAQTGEAHGRGEGIEVAGSVGENDVDWGGLGWWLGGKRGFGEVGGCGGVGRHGGDARGAER